jgi:hypothetical protein
MVVKENTKFRAYPLQESKPGKASYYGYKKSKTGK